MNPMEFRHGPDEIKTKKDLFRVRLISARPRRIHPRPGGGITENETTHSTSAGSANATAARRRQPGSSAEAITISPPALPNVIDDDGEDIEAEQPEIPAVVPERPPSTVIPPTVAVHADEEDQHHGGHEGEANASKEPDGPLGSLPAISIDPHSSIVGSKFGGVASLDVPSLTGRSRAASIVTQSSITSSGLLTTPTSESVFGGDASRASSSISFMVRERLHSLARDINRRTSVMKQHIQQPPTPDNVSLSSTAAGDEKSDTEQHDKRSLYSFGSEADEDGTSPPPPASAPIDTMPGGITSTKMATASAFLKRMKTRILPYSINTQTKRYLAWLFTVSSCLLYNAYAIPLRSAFPMYQTQQNVVCWLLADYFSDMIYLVDMFAFKPRLRFMRDGLPVKDRKETKKHYLCSWTFKLDLLSLLPLDIFYLVPGVWVNPLLRIPRLLKIGSYRDLFYMLDNTVKNPYALRIGKTLSYMVYMIHCNGCIYYTLSRWEGIGASEWAYNGEGNAYLRCFYFAAKLATSIGNNPDPTNFIEYTYMTICWMLGVFVFALLLGQIRDIVATANKNKETFRKTMDAALDYCAALNLPKETRDKVRQWFVYTWQEQKTLSENMLLEKLPFKLQTDLAISVHYQVLSKVQLFQDCEKSLLRDLVLKLKPVLYLPGDYVCRKGEVGKEMYIVNKGVVEVVGGPNNDTVFATLREGSVFGEISLLALAGGNRRTADVRSKGFSNLFVLSKIDLNDTIKDYPDAQRMLKRKAKKLIKNDATKKEKKPQSEIEKACEVSAHVSTPKMLPLVAQMVNPSTNAGKLLKMVLDDEAAKKKLRDEAETRPESQVSDFSESSSIVDDVMSGMPIDRVIQLHYEQHSRKKISDATLENVRQKLEQEHPSEAVIDETKGQQSGKLALPNDDEHHKDAVSIKVTESDNEDDSVSRNTLFHSSSSGDHRLTVPGRAVI